jgi:hypothetical protein
MKTAVFLSFIGLFIIIQCSPVPVSGRRQLNLIPQSQLLALSFQTYEQFLHENQVIRGTEDAKNGVHCRRKNSECSRTVFQSRK